MNFPASKTEDLNTLSSEWLTGETGLALPRFRVVFNTARVGKARGQGKETGLQRLNNVKSAKADKSQVLEIPYLKIK